MARTTPRTGAVVGSALVLLLALVVAPTGQAVAQDLACGDSPLANGTGYTPPARNPGSLPSGTPLPGPAILHEPLATAPQLENTGPWTAEPILISGTRTHRDGEYLYQDFLYDDLALAYPDEPDRYAGNAADLVEVRLTLTDDALAIRLTYNSMLVPDAVATTIALGDSGDPHDLPHNAGAVAPGEVFLTVHGCDGDVVDAATGDPLTPAPEVHTDLARRQVDIRLPFETFDPRPNPTLRIAAAAGLWDADAGEYLRPDPDAPAFFNVAFREYGPWVQNTWMVDSQTQALAAGDLTPLADTIDLAHLEASRDEPDLHGDIPTTGPMNRILVSHFEPAQGRGTSGGTHPCYPPDCTHQFSGRLQPYSIHVPETPPHPDGYGLVVNLHGANSNHNHFEGGPPDPPLQMWETFTEGAGRPSITFLPNARGQTYFYFGLAAADVFEVWADVAARYDLDPDHVVQTGSSMGGYGSYKMASQFPDLYTAVFPNIATPVAIRTDAPPGTSDDLLPMFASLRNVPVLATSGLNDVVVNYALTVQNQQRLDELGYRYDAWWFAGADGIGGHAEYRHHVPEEFAALMTEHGPTDRDPRRVTYVLNATMHEPDYGVTADKAYWLSGLALADESAVYGEIDVVSHGFPTGDPEVLAQEQGGGPSQNGSNPYERLTRRWGEAPVGEVADQLDITASNIATVIIDVDRARVTCEAAVNLDSPTPVEVTLVGEDCGAPLVMIAAPELSPTAASVAFALRAFPEAQDTPVEEVLYASNEVFADALASGPLQATRPLLLGDPAHLEFTVTDAIAALGASRVRVLGGPAAVSDDIVDALEDEGLEVVRTFGPTRIETAAAIAEMATGGDALLVRAYGDNDEPTRGFADALAAGAWAAQTGDPMLLTATGSLSQPTADALETLAPGGVAVIGGDAAVSDEVLAAVGPSAQRVAGPDRAGTATAIATARGFTPETPATAVLVVDGSVVDGWTRGFAAAAFAASRSVPVLLADGDALPPSTLEFLADSVAPVRGETVVWCAAALPACQAALARAGG